MSGIIIQRFLAMHPMGPPSPHEASGLGIARVRERSRRVPADGTPKVARQLGEARESHTILPLNRGAFGDGWRDPTAPRRFREYSAFASPRTKVEIALGDEDQGGVKIVLYGTPTRPGRVRLIGRHVSER